MCNTGIQERPFHAKSNTLRRVIQELLIGWLALVLLSMLSTLGSGAETTQKKTL
jgi:hypothetical protein